MKIKPLLTKPTGPGVASAWEKESVTRHRIEFRSCRHQESISVRVAVTCLLLCFCLTTHLIAVAQENTGWAQPSSLLLTPEDDWGFIPDVTTGPSGNTYVFFPGRPVNDAAGQPGIYFSRWEDDHWSSPKDVLVAPDGNVLHTLAAVEDGNGYLNLVMTGSTAWYSRAPMHEADNPRAWSIPVGIFSQDRAMTIDAVLGSDGATHVAIGSDRGAVYHVAISADGTPGYPTIVRSIVDDEYYPDVVSVVSTLQGSLHMCWVEVRSGSRGFYCSTSHDQGSTWTAVEQVAAGHRAAASSISSSRGYWRASPMAESAWADASSSSPRMMASHGPSLSISRRAYTCRG